VKRRALPHQHWREPIIGAKMRRGTGAHAGWRAAVTLEDTVSSVARITHISARSETGFEDAIRTAVERASQTLRNISGAWVKDQKVEVTDGRVSAYQVILEVTFVLE
jgi:dodecin